MKKRKNKAEREHEFVQMILDKGGIKAHMKMYERGHMYYAMELNNGEGRYWTDFSQDSLKKLGISESEPNNE